MTEAVQTVEDTHWDCVVVSVLTCFALFHFMSDLKTAQKNMQRSLNRELIPYEFELGLTAAEAGAPLVV